MGMAFKELFAFAAILEACRLLLIIASETLLFQMNVNSVFLNEFINLDVFVEQPIGFESLNYPDHVHKLKKILYDLKQLSFRI